MLTFVDRLTKCAETGGLSTSDLSNWFGVPYATMWTWMHGTHSPDRGSFGAKRDVPAEHEASITALEAYIKNNNGFRVPFDVGAHKRPNYIKKVRRDGKRARISEVGSAK